MPGVVYALRRRAQLNLRWNFLDGSHWSSMLEFMLSMTKAWKKISLAALILCALGLDGTRATAAEEWISLFNGRDLSGWTPKIKGYDLGVNFSNTFRVQDGVLAVNYDGYDQFNNRFGHLFYKQPFSNYVLRLEYRFVGSQLKDGPGWALRNSGIMLHCQAPGTIGKDQDFPVSLECQLLGGDGQHPRSTCNLCSPGTHVVMNGQLITQHCNDSKSKTYHGEQWVTAEVEVHGNRKIIHRVNGEPVIEYDHPQYDTGDADAKKLLTKGQSDPQIYGGYISLQSESHPVQFRNIVIRELKD